MTIIYGNYNIFFDNIFEEVTVYIGMTHLKTDIKYYGSIDNVSIESLEQTFRGLKYNLIISIDEISQDTITVNIMNTDEMYTITLNRVAKFPLRRYQQVLLTLQEDVGKLTSLTSSLITGNKELEEKIEDLEEELEKEKKETREHTYFTFIPKCPPIPCFTKTLNFVESLGPQFPITCKSCNHKVSREDFLGRFSITIYAERHSIYHDNNMTHIMKRKHKWCLCEESKGHPTCYSTLEDYIDVIRPRYYDEETDTYASENLFDIELAIHHPTLIKELVELSIFHSGTNPDDECDMSYLQNLTNLKKLKLSLTHLTTIQWIKDLKELEELDLAGCTSLKNINVCAKLPKLKKINIYNTGVKTHTINCETSGITIVGTAEYTPKSYNLTTPVTVKIKI